MPDLSPADIEYQLAHFDDDKSSVVTVVSSVCFGAALVAVSLRLLARRLTRIPCKQDDYLIVAALILASGLLVENLLAVQAGLGKQLIKTGVDGLVKELQLTAAIEMTYIFCHLAIKLSILLLYRRLFTTHQRRLKLAFYMVGIYVVAWTVASFFTVLFQCTPVHYSWDNPRGGLQGHCFNLTAAYVGSGLTNTVSDLVVLILPMPIVWQLRIPMKQKLVICGIFLLGGFACAASIVRIVFLVYFFNGPINTTYAAVDPIIWSIIEPCIGITCACLPVHRPVFKACLAKLSLIGRKVSIPSFLGSSNSRLAPIRHLSSQPIGKSWNKSTDITTKSSDVQCQATISGQADRNQLSSAVVLTPSIAPRLSIDEDTWNLPRDNPTLWEHIRRSHVSWLLTESDEDVIAPRGVHASWLSTESDEDLAHPTALHPRLIIHEPHGRL